MTRGIPEQIDDHLRTAGNLKASAAVLEQVAALIIGAFKGGRRLYIFGNGGSAADAQHIAAELVGRFRRGDRPALPAMALTTDTSGLTAIGNDYGYDEVFKRQVEGLVVTADVVWALSVSGTSPNVIKALEAARDRGACVVGFTGKNGAQLEGLSDVCLMVDHADSARVQEAHQLAYHIVCGLIEEAIA